MARRFSPVVVIVYLALFVSVFWRILREFASRRSEAKNSLSSYTSFSRSSLRKDTSSFTTPRRFIPLAVNTGASATTNKESPFNDHHQLSSTNVRKNDKLEKTSTNLQTSASSKSSLIDDGINHPRRRIRKQVPVRPWSIECNSKANSIVRQWVLNAKNSFVDPKCNPDISSYVSESELIESRQTEIGIGRQPCDRYIWHGRALYSGILDTFPCAYLNITFTEEEVDEDEDIIKIKNEKKEKEVNNKMKLLLTNKEKGIKKKTIATEEDDKKEEDDDINLVNEMKEYPRPTVSSDFFVVVVITDKTFKKSFDGAITWGRRMFKQTSVRPFFIAQEKHMKEADEVYINGIKQIGQLFIVSTFEETMKNEVQSSNRTLLTSKMENELWVLYALKIAAKEKPSYARWIIFLTDSTWLSLEEASSWLSYHEYRLPLVIGHIESGQLVDTYKTRQLETPLSGLSPMATYPAASAGLILSSIALEKISTAVFTSTCPWPNMKHVKAHRWDVLIGRCSFTLLIPQLFSPSLVPSMDSELGKSLHMDNNPTSVESIITINPYDQYSYERYHDRFNGASPDDFETILHALKFKDKSPQEFLDQKGD
jgi:hypothetical protein